MPNGVDPSTLYAFRAPTDAIAYLQARVPDANNWNWFDLQVDAHARVFTVARAARLDVLQSIRDGLIQYAGNEREFIRNLTPQLQRMGWWGRQTFITPSGQLETAQLGSPRRLRHIFRANTAASYSAARYRQQLADAASRPFWMYVAVMDERTRASHAAMNGRVFRFDDPIWRTHYPPNDHNCRCRVRALTEAEVKRRGLKVESSDGALKPVEQEVGEDRDTGEVVSMPSVQWTGRSPITNAPVSMTPNAGWAGNPGLVPWQPNLDRYSPDLARWYVSESLRGPAFARTWNRLDRGLSELRASPASAGISAQELQARATALLTRGERFAVAILGAEDRAALGVRTQTVLVSDETLLKQALSRDGQGFDLETYWQVQSVIEQAQVVVREGANVLVYIRRGDDWFHAVIRRTASGEALFLTSFRRTREADMRRAMARGEVLRDQSS